MARRQKFFVRGNSGLITNVNSLTEKLDEEPKQRIPLIDTLLEPPDLNDVDIGKIKAIHPKLLDLSHIRETNAPHGEAHGSVKSLPWAFVPASPAPSPPGLRQDPPV